MENVSKVTTDEIEPSCEGAAYSDCRLLRIGELSCKTGISLRMLHYYEELELIRPAKRTKGGFRLYTPDQLEILSRVQQLREVGMELSEIRALFAAERMSAAAPIPALKQQVTQELRRATSLVYRYAQLRDDLDATLDILCECERRGCSETPGGSSCPRCEVTRTRDHLPPMFSTSVVSAK